jgi:membrane-bound lytic murein transglycosylase A
MGLADAARRSLDYYHALPEGTSFAIGADRVSAARMADSLEALLKLTDRDPEDFRREARRLFKAYRSPNPVVFSSYYEHSLDAALERGGDYQFPIYAKPPDLVEKDSPGGKIVGRIEEGKFVPYFTRREIDSGGALEGKGLEIAWAADPLDVFFLQVQGSGWFRLPGGEKPLRVRFAAHNGRPYVSVGGSMIKKGLLSEGGSAREKLVGYMRRHPEERQELLNVNPRYVFFRIDRGPDAEFALGSAGVPLTPWRSVAADKGIFPPGALAWMETEKGAVRRFVLVQDEGGAIKGSSRIDYFVGGGKEAEDFAVRFWAPGRFYVLVLK